MFYSALVVNNVDKTLSGIIEVYVPMIMKNQRRNEKKIESKNISNPFEIINTSVDKSSFNNLKVNESHTIKSYPFNYMDQKSGTYIIPEEGDEVFVFFKDNDFNLCYYMVSNAYKPANIIDYGKIVELEKDAKDPEKRVKHKIPLLTKTGHIIFLNENKNQEMMLLQSSNKHKFLMEKTNQSSIIKIESEKGHQFILDDINSGIVMKTKGGHMLSVDDAQGGLNLKANGGGRLTIDDVKRVIQLVSPMGTGLEFDDKTNKLTVASLDIELNGKKDIDLKAINSITSDSKVSINNKTTNFKVDAHASINMNSVSVKINADGSMNISSNGLVNIKGASVNIDGSNIMLGQGATSPMVKGDQLLTWLSTHTHGTAVGPSSPPVVPVIPAQVLSLISFVK